MFILNLLKFESFLQSPTALKLKSNNLQVFTHTSIHSSLLPYVASFLKIKELPLALRRRLKNAH